MISAQNVLVGLQRFGDPVDYVDDIKSLVKEFVRVNC